MDEYSFEATIHEDAAPESVKAMRGFLPLQSTLLHVRYSGIATWIEIDEIDLPDVPRESHDIPLSR